MKHPLTKIIEFQKQGKPVGIYSACTANEFVLEACMEQAIKTKSVLLIESTSNQVDHYGGYTGMTPKDFVNYVQNIANKTGLPMDRIILGGDHLGPLTFTKYDEEQAMKEAKELVKQYVLAGFTKIHIDTSMKVNSDDPNTRLSDETIARRGATLAKVCEEAYEELLKTNPKAIQPVYIVGSEVPIPGGSQDAVETEMQVTKVSDFKATYQAFKEAFAKEGLTKAWDNVIAIVVQPGVEEKDAGCTQYNREKAIDLMNSIKEYPTLIFEGHSTDYQTKVKLKELVEDGVGILKVGPGLTFAAREAIFSLAFIEKELYKNTDVKQSNIMEILEEEMLKEPKYWSKHYHGSDNEKALKRKYSFSDRSRYYLPLERVSEAIQTLLHNLKDGVPLNLLSQFMPIAYTKVRLGELENDPIALIKDRVAYTVDEYLYATNQQEL
ncbi:MAG: class II D-tagatose-bisphosphate aldolase, non-catalytic subunit [Erysipelotrichaceae bacterium]